MALFAWKPEYSVNISQIDEQHKKLIGMVNELHEAMAAGRGKDVLGNILKKLADYTATHFANEEKIMKDNGYPDFDEHIEKHRKMTGKVKALMDDFKGGRANLTLDVMDFLKNWLDKHILGTDKKYSGFLNGKGVH